MTTTVIKERRIAATKTRYEVSHTIESLECSFVSLTPVWKRGMDIVGATLMLICLAPILVLIYLTIKVYSPGPAFFMQRRTGYLGKSFNMYKFRTMKLDATASAHKKQICDEIHNNLTFSKIENDSRIFPLGKLLRQSCLDELPQLLNVLKGEMSLVGPRPELPYAVNEFKCWHCARLNVLPGMTGLWQINGKNSTTFEQMVRYDINYIRRLSFLLDLKILILTIPAIIKQVNQGTNK